MIARILMTKYLYIDDDGVVHRRYYDPETPCGLLFFGDVGGRVATYHYALEVTCLACSRYKDYPE